MTEQTTAIQHPYPNEHRRYTAIRIVKQNGLKRGTPLVSFSAPPAARLQLLEDDIFTAESDADYYFYFAHDVQEEACIVNFRVNWDESEIKAIVSEKNILAFHSQDGFVQFELDLNGLQGRSSSLDVHSFIRKPGLNIGIYQNHPSRNVGAFTNMTWPQTQIDAAEHYMFATREILQALGIIEGLVADGLGYVELLSFETSNAYHGDYPPHWHIIYRWTNYAGSQAPHIYMDEQGRNTNNIVTIDGVPNVQYDYGAEEWCYFHNEFANEAFAIQVCADGGVAITKRNAAIYKIMPYNRERGVEVMVDGQLVGTVHLHNDTSLGRIDVKWQRVADRPGLADSYHERITYDPLLGTVMNIEK